MYGEPARLVRSKVGPPSTGTQNPPNSNMPAAKHSLVFRVDLRGPAATAPSTGDTNARRRDTRRFKKSTKLNRLFTPSLAFITVHPYIKAPSENRQAHPAEILSTVPANQGIIRATKRTAASLAPYVRLTGHRARGALCVRVAAAHGAVKSTGGNAFSWMPLPPGDRERNRYPVKSRTNTCKPSAAGSAHGAPAAFRDRPRRDLCERTPDETISPAVVCCWDGSRNRRHRKRRKPCHSIDIPATHHVCFVSTRSAPTSTTQFAGHPLTRITRWPPPKKSKVPIFLTSDADSIQH
jgi:hypothetical protein